jgi:hypothetical protein
MKKALYILLAIGFTLTFSACPFDGGVDSHFYIYIAGETGRTVQIVYLGQEDDGAPIPKYVYGDDNTVLTKTVTIPYFKEIHYNGAKQSCKNIFLEIVSENDSTTKAIMFDDELSLADSTCNVLTVWMTENAVGECTYCKDLPKDSVLHYLKSIKYPCYLEFAKGNTRKKVMMRDYWGY